MKKNIFFLLLCYLFIESTLAHAQGTIAVRELIQRISRQSEIPVSLKLKPEKNSTYYQYEVQKGILRIQASDNVSLCRGFYDYIKDNHLGMYTWTGNSIAMPSKELPDLSVKKTISPFANHYYFNVCTYGYSMPYWDWERWEQEIDWMALHGINMPLALVGYEAIIARVWKKMGLTDEEINHYFVGPAHLPWMRMGNISGIDGPLNEDWHKKQIALQHQILDRMRSLDMKPICPGFPGFIPRAFKRIHPELEIVETQWGGAFSNWMISPQEPLFKKIGTAFIREWEKEFGKCDYYLVDSFNEMDIPFPEKGNPKRYEMAASYGKSVYESIRKANAGAVWVMQGWMFGYQRHIWDYKTLGALVSKVPDDKILLLDLAVDYNKHFWHSEVNWEYYKGFYNKQLVYSVIPNMGGKVGMTGILDFYANGHLEALSSPNKGNLIAHGLAPEGIENNEVLYELVTDAGWSNHKIEIREWLKDYSENRYGKTSADIMSAWDYLLKSVYGTFTDHPRFNWQLRPGMVKNGSINICEDYFKGLECFVNAADDLGNNPMYQIDMAEMTAQYLGGKVEILTKMIDQEYLLGDTLQAVLLQSRFETLMLGMDALLSKHPTLRLNRWLDFASKAAETAQQKKQYEMNARRIVTVWGPPVDDYAARIWSGLIGSYYLERWKNYYASRTKGIDFNMAAWERNWVENSKKTDYEWGTIDLIDFSKRMMALSKDISEKDLKLNRPDMIGTWNIGDKEWKEIKLNISARMLKQMNGFSLETIKGNGTIKISGFKLEADGKLVTSSHDTQTLQCGKKVTYRFSLPTNLQANNGCIMTIRLTSLSEKAAGIVVVDK